MTDQKLAEIQSRMSNLIAEVDRLAIEFNLVGGVDPSDEEAAAPAAPAQSTPANHDHFLRTLRDLMWQGRWSLAYHLTEALEAQGVSQADFHSSTIRAWALASQPENRSRAEAQLLAQSLFEGPECSEPDMAAKRLFQWATLISLLGSVEPDQVRPLADRFAPPEDLPATAAWWNQYVDALTTMPRPPARWARHPDAAPVASEIDQQLLNGPAEPLRLAASCLMMSVRKAMRHVPTVSMASQRLILNAEAERGAIVRFTETGSPAPDAAGAGRSVSQLAVSELKGRNVIISEREPIVARPAKAEEHNAAASNAQVSLPESTRTPSVPMQPAEPAPQVASDDSLRAARRAAARERLNRYADRLSIQNGARTSPTQAVRPTSKDILQFVPQGASEPANAGVATTATISDSRPASPGDEPVQSAVEFRTVCTTLKSEHVVPDVADQRDERRGIHEATVATAFAEGRNGYQGAAINVRPGSRPMWSTVLNPQAAIVAGLLVIAGAVVAGMGSGLAAKGLVNEALPVGDRQAQSATDDAVDFTVIE